MKTIYLARHAGDGGDLTVDLRAGQRAGEGRVAARTLAERLSRERPRPMVILCSVAPEAIQTWKAIVTRLEPGAEVIMDEELFEANSGEILARLQSLPEGVETVLVVGHNPGLQNLAVVLAGDGGDIDLVSLRRTFPNGALAKLSTGVPWIDLWPGGAYLEAVSVPGYPRP